MQVLDGETQNQNTDRTEVKSSILSSHTREKLAIALLVITVGICGCASPSPTVETIPPVTPTFDACTLSLDRQAIFAQIGIEQGKLATQGIEAPNGAMLDLMYPVDRVEVQQIENLLKLAHYFVFTAKWENETGYEDAFSPQDYQVGSVMLIHDLEPSYFLGSSIGYRSPAMTHPLQDGRRVSEIALVNYQRANISLTAEELSISFLVEACQQLHRRQSFSNCPPDRYSDPDGRNHLHFEALCNGGAAAYRHFLEVGSSGTDLFTAYEDYLRTYSGDYVILPDGKRLPILIADPNTYRAIAFSVKGPEFGIIE